MNEMKTWQKAWLGGLFEGEGSITISRNGHGRRICVKIGMCDKDVVDTAHRLTGVGNRTTSPGQTQKNGTPGRTVYIWQISMAEDVLDFMEMVRPFLHARRKSRWAEIKSEFLQYVRQTPDPRAGSNALNRRLAAWL